MAHLSYKPLVLRAARCRGTGRRPRQLCMPRYARCV